MYHEEVNGIIIGGDHKTGSLHKYEDGQQQGPKFYADTDEELVELGTALFHKLGGKQAYPRGLELRMRP